MSKKWAFVITALSSLLLSSCPAAEVVGGAVVSSLFECVFLDSNCLQDSQDKSDSSEIIYRTISLQNFCPKKSEIYVAIAYANLDSQWVTEGWWEVDRDKGKIPTGIQTANSYVYFYAEKGKKYIWDGKGFAGSVDLTITEDEDDEFRSIDGVGLPDNKDLKTVSFYRVDLRESSQEHTEPFNCKE